MEEEVLEVSEELWELLEGLEEEEVKSVQPLDLAEDREAEVGGAVRQAVRQVPSSPRSPVSPPTTSTSTSPR